MSGICCFGLFVFGLFESIVLTRHSYYLLYGENVTAFPNNFRMIAGDPFQRNFTWPVPDPPKSTWSGAQLSQAALRQKALGFNCLNYDKPAEPSLYRHFLPNKTYLDEHCTDGLRLELMFPSCWNGKDVDSPDHTSHVLYPSLVMDGTCPEGYETRLVSLFYETIWNTYAFKDQDGYFVLANGDPTGFGYHGDFMVGWQDGVLQEAIDTCTSKTGEVGDCKIFNLQSETKQRQCSFDMPTQLLDDAVDFIENGLPGGVPIEWGPGYATPPSPSTHVTQNLPIPSIFVPLPSLSLGLDLGGNFFGTADIRTTDKPAPIETATSTQTAPAAEVNAASITTTSAPTSSPTPTPTPTISTIEKPIVEEIIYLEKDVIVMINEKGVPYATHTGAVHTVSSTTTTLTETSTVTSYAEKRDNAASGPEKHDHVAGHARRHAHHLGHFHKRVF